jgi:hypothetical protein
MKQNWNILDFTKSNYVRILNVKMVDENVYVKVFSDYSEVKCEFTFNSESNAEQDVLMGFPALLIMEGGVEDPTTKLTDFRRSIMI